MLVAREFTIEDKERRKKMKIGELRRIDNLGRMDTYEKLLIDLENNKFQERIKPEWSPQTTYGVFDNDKLVGAFNIRHKLKEELINHGGNIGYQIRPIERRKGYGTKILYLALEKAKELDIKKVLVTCRIENIASSKVIENNGGVYENDYYYEAKNRTYKRYWIDLSK